MQLMVYATSLDQGLSSPIQICKKSYKSTGLDFKLFGCIIDTMKRYIIVVAVLAVLGFTSTAFATQEKPHKVTICHADGQGGYVRIITDKHAIKGHFYNHNEPKRGHEDDLLLEGEVECPVLDVCENIEGDQEVVPENYTEEDGVCTEVVEEEPPVVITPTPVVTPTPVTPVVVQQDNTPIRGK